MIDRFRLSSFRTHGLRGLIVVSALVASAACVRTVPPRALVLHVSNQLGRTIAEIRKKPCEDLEIAFAPIPESRIGPGETRGIELPPSCVDVVAFDNRGRIVGEQRNLTMLPGASWVLRR